MKVLICGKGGSGKSTIASMIAKRMGYVPQRADVSQITVFDFVLLRRKPHITWDVSTKDIKIVKKS